MRTASFCLALAAAVNVAMQAPLTAYAAPPVQPVPYNQSQPVPVGAQAAGPTPATPAPTATGGAPATGGGGDTIYLKGGGMIRGRLVEVIPNDHATIALSTGQSAIVEWSRIDRIEQQQAAVPNVAVQQGPAVPAVTAPAGGSVWLHIDSDRDLVLEGRPADSGWSVICNAPCDQQVALNADFKISGPGIRASKPFRINAQSGERVVISVSPGSSGGFVGGIILVSVGPAVLFIGLLVMLVGAAENSIDGSGGGTVTTGGIMSLVGLGALVGGIILIVGNARTTETQEILRAGAPPARPKDDAWLRLPTWHDGNGLENALPKTPTLPIFSRAF